MVCLGVSSLFVFDVAQAQLFVANGGGQYGDDIGEYTLTGGVINASLVTGLNNPNGLALAVSDGDLFVANGASGTVGEYTTSGATVNSSLITGLSTPTGVAVSGGDVYVANYGTGTIGEYTTAGVPVNASLISFWTVISVLTRLREQAGALRACSLPPF